MKLFFFWTVTLLTVTKWSLHAWPYPTKGGSGVNLSGKMFTVSSYNGGLVLYSPYYPPPWASPTPYQTRGYTSDYYYYTSTPSYTQTSGGTTERSAPSTATGSYTTSKPTTKPTPKPPTRPTTYLPTTTAPSTRGVSVCLRYITDSTGGYIFTLSPSRYPQLKLEFSGSGYSLSFAYSNQVYLLPSIRLWPGLRLNMWTSICLTVDTIKGVAQMFRDSDMSPRKLLMVQHVWQGEPAIDFSDFEGQLTEVQMWDYPLSYKEVLYYTSSGYFGVTQGSVLRWSDISYSLRGRTLLEDSYERQMRQPTFKRGRRRNLKGKEKRRKLLHTEEKEERMSNF